MTIALSRRVLVALDKCIEHWTENLEHAQTGDYGEVDISHKACALCSLCLEGCLVTDNHACPIMQVTGCDSCDNTPYYKVSRQLLHDRADIDRPALIKVVRESCCSC